MRITDIETGDILELGGVFGWSAPCLLASCPWRQEHRSHQVRDLVYIDQSSGVFTQVSDLFSHVIVCSQAGCGHVVYTNNPDMACIRLQRHSASLHKTDEGGTEILTKDFLYLICLIYESASHSVCLFVVIMKTPQWTLSDIVLAAV